MQKLLAFAQVTKECRSILFPFFSFLFFLILPVDPRPITFKVKASCKSSRPGRPFSFSCLTFLLPSCCCCFSERTYRYVHLKCILLSEERVIFMLSLNQPKRLFFPTDPTDSCVSRPCLGRSTKSRRRRRRKYSAVAPLPVTPSRFHSLSTPVPGTIHLDWFHPSLLRSHYTWCARTRARAGEYWIVFTLR